MKLIERYVLQAFLAAFFLAWLILSFVLTIGLLVRITKLLIEGLPAKTIGMFLMVGLPETLTLTVPIALLVSALLVFSRLSADSEIAALRACGVNLLHIIRWPLTFGLLCSLLGVYINNEVATRSHEVRRNLRSTISVDVGLELLEPGRMIDDFPKLKVFFERKEGNWVHDLLVFDNSDPRLTREISAQKALISTNGTDIVLDMYKVRSDPIDVDNPGVGTAERLRHIIPDALRKRAYRRKEKDFSFFELLDKIAVFKLPQAELPETARLRQLSIYRTEFNTRLVYALAALCFVWVGVPLGIRSHRKESTIGMGISLIVAMTYYLCIILAKALEKQYWLRPDLIVWLPVVICGILATYLIPKNL